MYNYLLQDYIALDTILSILTLATTVKPVYSSHLWGALVKQVATLDRSICTQMTLLL